MGAFKQIAFLYYVFLCLIQIAHVFFYVRRELDSKCGGGMYFGKDVGQRDRVEFVIRLGGARAPDNNANVSVDIITITISSRDCVLSAESEFPSELVIFGDTVSSTNTSLLVLCPFFILPKLTRTIEPARTLKPREASNRIREVTPNSVRSWERGIYVCLG